jgi:hypothetical protein
MLFLLELVDAILHDKHSRFRARTLTAKTIIAVAGTLFASVDAYRIKHL